MEERMNRRHREAACEVAAFVVVLALLTWIVCALTGCAGGASSSGPACEYAPGQPLDAIRYEPPTWTRDCGEQYRVTDRTSGKSWWLLRMYGGQWVVLPADGSDG